MDHIFVFGAILYSPNRPLGPCKTSSLILGVSKLPLPIQMESTGSMTPGPVRKKGAGGSNPLFPHGSDLAG